MERQSPRHPTEAVRGDALDALAALARRLMSCDAIAIVAGPHHAAAVEPVARLPRDPAALVDPLTAEDLGLGFYAGVPVRAGDRDLGLLAAIDASPREFRADELEVLKLVARVAAALVDQAEDAGG